MFYLIFYFNLTRYPHMHAHMFHSIPWRVEYNSSNGVEEEMIQGAIKEWVNAHEGTFLFVKVHVDRNSIWKFLYFNAP